MCVCVLLNLFDAREDRLMWGNIQKGYKEWVLAHLKNVRVGGNIQLGLGYYSSPHVPKIPRLGSFILE